MELRKFIAAHERHHKCAVDHRVLKIAAVTAEFILLRRPAYSGLNGIKVNVPDDCEQIRKIIDGLSFVPLLKKMACPRVFFIVSADITGAETHEDVAERYFARSDQKMDMVRHKAICQNSESVSLPAVT